MSVSSNLQSQPNWLETFPNEVVSYGFDSGGMWFSGDSSNPSVPYPVRTNYNIGSDETVEVVYTFIHSDVDEFCPDQGICFFNANVEPYWNWETSFSRIAVQYNCGVPEISGANTNLVRSSYTMPLGDNDVYTARVTYNPIAQTVTHQLFSGTSATGSPVDTIVLENHRLEPGDYRLGFSADLDTGPGPKSYFTYLQINQGPPGSGNSSEITRIFRAIHLPRRRREVVSEEDGTPINVQPGELIYDVEANKLYAGLDDTSTVEIASGGGGAVQSVAGKTGAVVLEKADVGLGNVDNTSDANKPISAATQTALDGKAPSVHAHSIADVTGLQTALNGKATPSDVTNAVADIVGAAPASLNTLQELAQALNDDAEFASTVTNAIAGKADAAHTHSGPDIILTSPDYEGSSYTLEEYQIATFLYAFSDASITSVGYDARIKTSREMLRAAPLHYPSIAIPPSAGQFVVTGSNGALTTSTTVAAGSLPLATTTTRGAVIVGTGLGLTSGTISVSYGLAAGTACQGNDSRLSDARTPIDGSVTTAKIADSAVTDAKISSVSAAKLTGAVPDTALSSNVLLASRKPELVTNRSALRLFYSRWLNALQNTGANRRISTMIAGDSLAGRLAGWLHAEILLSAQFWGSRGQFGENAAGPLWTNGFNPGSGLTNGIIGLGTAWSNTNNAGPQFSGGWISGTVFDVAAPVTLSATGSGTSLTVTGAAVSTTATGSSGATSITLTSASGVYAGMTITGSNIPAGATIVRLSGTTATLSAATTGALSSTAVTIALPINSSTGRMFVSGTNIASGTEATAINTGTGVVTLGTAATGAVSNNVDFQSYLQFPAATQFGSNMATRFGVYYIQQPGGGSFVLEYATSATGATWTQVGSAISTNGTLLGGIASASGLSRNRYWFRARVTSGTVRFISGWYDDGAKTTRGYDGISSSAGGISPAQSNTCEAAIVTPILAHMDPALITFHYDDLNASVDLGNLLAKMRGTVTKTASGTLNQSTITVNDATGLYVGMSGFSPDGSTVPGTTITSISGTTLTMSTANATTFSGVSVTFRTPCPALVIANHAKVGEADATTRASVTDWQTNATTYNYAVFDALSAMGTASELQANAQQGDGTHLSTEAYAIGGHLLTTDLMAPIQGYIAGKGYTTGLNSTTIGVNTVRLGDVTNGVTWITPYSNNPPPGLITTDTYNVYTNLSMNYALRDVTGATTVFQITSNPFSATNRMPQAPVWWQSSSDATSYSPITSLTGGVSTWAFGQNFSLRNNNNRHTLRVGPMVASTSLTIPIISAGSENTQTITVANASATNNSVVLLGWSAALPAGVIVAQAWVSSANTVSIRLYNYAGTSSASATLTCNVSVMEVLIPAT